MPSLLDGMNVTFRRAALETRTCWTKGQRGGVGRVRGRGIPRNVQAGERVQLVVGVREREGEGSGVPVPAAKQLLHGSSSLFDLSHLLLVFRH
jgi:hypothetical protein